MRALTRRETSLPERQSSFILFARLYIYIFTAKHPLLRRTPALSRFRWPGGTGQNSDLASQSVHIRGSVLSAAIEGPTPGSNISPTELCLNKSSLGQFGLHVIPKLKEASELSNQLLHRSTVIAVVIATRRRCFDTPMMKIRRECLTKPVSCEPNGKFTIWRSACTEPQRNEKKRTPSRVP